MARAEVAKVPRVVRTEVWCSGEAEVGAMAVAARVEVVGMEVAAAAPAVARGELARGEVAMTAVPDAAVGRAAAVVGRWRPFWNPPPCTHPATQLWAARGGGRFQCLETPHMRRGLLWLVGRAELG